MAINPGYFQPGEVANPKGRPTRSKNKINRDFYAAYEKVKELPGYQHPLRLMYDWVMDQNLPIEVRAAMLKEFGSYLCVKPKQTIGIETKVPVFQTEAQAEQFLAEFISAIAPDLDPVELASMIRQFIMSKREGEELKFKTRDHNGSASTPQIILQNSPGPLPGTDIIMPKINTTELNNGRTIDLEKNPGPELPAIEADNQETNFEPQAKDPQP